VQLVGKNTRTTTNVLTVNKEPLLDTEIRQPHAIESLLQSGM
jgi:hypothetical protein